MGWPLSGRVAVESRSLLVFSLGGHQEATSIRAGVFTLTQLLDMLCRECKHCSSSAPLIPERVPAVSLSF